MAHYVGLEVGVSLRPLNAPHPYWERARRRCSTTQQDYSRGASTLHYIEAYAKGAIMFSQPILDIAFVLVLLVCALYLITSHRRARRGAFDQATNGDAIELNSPSWRIDRDRDCAHDSAASANNCSHDSFDGGRGGDCGSDGGGDGGGDCGGD